jgi:membrane fusion protein, copper/silver efflux system
MYVNVVIRAGLGRKLAVPEEAVLDTGERRLVFVKTGPGRYDPREVSIGREAEDHLEVLDGLEEGEEVVTSANFLIDSESKLKSALGAPEAKGHSH